MIVAGVCMVFLLLALSARAGNRKLPLDRGEILRVRRFADRMRREQLLPYE